MPREGAAKPVCGVTDVLSGGVLVRGGLRFSEMWGLLAAADMCAGTGERAAGFRWI